MGGCLIFVEGTHIHSHHLILEVVRGFAHSVLINLLYPKRK
jgi:hypothetical protein